MQDPVEQIFQAIEALGLEDQERFYREFEARRPIPLPGIVQPALACDELVDISRLGLPPTYEIALLDRPI